jgi:hypothetical protein
MTVRRLRWALAAAAALAALLAPACSRTEAQSRAVPRPRPSVRGEAKAAKPETPESQPDRTRATGAARRHPFAPVADSGGRRARTVAGLGPLVLKGVCGPDDRRTAIIQEGRNVHFVRVNEAIGGYTVLAIRADEVVLGAGHRKRILPLYDGR